MSATINHIQFHTMLGISAKKFMPMLRAGILPKPINPHEKKHTHLRWRLSDVEIYLGKVKVDDLEPQHFIDLSFLPTGLASVTLTHPDGTAEVIHLRRP